MKKIFLFICASFITLSTLAHDFEIDGIYYNHLEGNSVEVTYRGSSFSSYLDEYSSSIVIPETVTYGGTTYYVTGIGERTFSSCPSLTSVTIGNNVTSIGRYAFYYCQSLTSITIPNSVTNIGSFAFQDCHSLTSVTIGNSVTSIGHYAFQDCSSLTSVTIGNSVTSIGDNAFNYCSSLTSITIGNSVTNIGNSTFEKCSSLSSITIPNSVTSIGDRAFAWCSSLTSITIGNNVTSIGYDAFQECHSLTRTNHTGDIASWCNIKFKGNDANPMYYSHNFYINDQEVKDLVIPNTVDSIHDNAFNYCSSLTSITIGNSVTSIGNYAFQYCTGLTSITIPNSVTSIGDRAFWGCSLTNIIIESVTPPAIGSNICQKEKIYIHIPDNTKSTYQAAWGNDYIFINNETALVLHVETPGTLSDLIFDAGTRPAYVVRLTLTGTLNSDDFTCMNETMTQLKDVDLSEITNESGVNFNGKEKLLRIVLPKNLTSIDRNAFSYCKSLTSITIPESVTSINKRAFYNCDNLQSISLPDGLYEIGSYAFGYCDLISITIPATVTSIGENAFTATDQLSSITCLSTTPPQATNLGAPTETCKLIVPQTAYKDYLRHAYWGQFLTILNCKLTTETNNDAWGVVTGVGYYTEKDVVILTATPNEGYHFVKWSDGNTDNPRTITIMQDTTFTAEFAINTYEVVVNSNEHGVVTGVGVYNHGDTVTLTATANEGYVFVNWTENDVEVSTEANYSFEVTSDRNLVANFQEVAPEYNVMDITMTNLVVTEMGNVLVLTASDDNNTGLNVILAVDTDGSLTSDSYIALVQGWNKTELPILEGKITKTYSEELATDVYSGLIVVEYMEGKLGLNLTMYSVPVEVVDVVVNDATITVEKLSDGVGSTYELINVSAKWAESTLWIEGIEKNYEGFVQIKETFMVDGEEEWYIWMGQNAVVTTVDNVLTVSGEFKNNFTGDVYNVTISGTIPSTPTALDNVEVSISALKAIINGQLIIILDGKAYNVIGAEIQ